MRKLTEQDLITIIGTEQSGYTIERARIKEGEFSDFDYYGVVLGKSKKGNYVTWQFHLDTDEKPDFYWGRYMDGNLETALANYETRGQ